MQQALFAPPAPIHLWKVSIPALRCPHPGIDGKSRTDRADDPSDPDEEGRLTVGRIHQRRAEPSHPEQPGTPGQVVDPQEGAERMAEEPEVGVIRKIGPQLQDQVIEQFHQGIPPRQVPSLPGGMAMTRKIHPHPEDPALCEESAQRAVAMEVVPKAMDHEHAADRRAFRTKDLPVQGAP
jgi:hypothetical protein